MIAQWLVAFACQCGKRTLLIQEVDEMESPTLVCQHCDRQNKMEILGVKLMLICKCGHFIKVNPDLHYITQWDQVRHASHYEGITCDVCKSPWYKKP